MDSTAANTGGNIRKVHFKYVRRRYNRWDKHPLIRLSGLNLAKYGFEVGDTIEVSFEQSRIVIRKAPVL